MIAETEKGMTLVMSDRQLAQSGSGWAVSTPHTMATDAASRVFRDGGNAVDAALAAAAMLTVVYPNQCSIGGDLIALVGSPDGQVCAVNATGRAPDAVDVGTLADHERSMPISGAITVTVPGVVSGWEALRRVWGTRSLADVLHEAETAAREGVAVAAGLARDFGREEAKILADPGLRSVFMPEGQTLHAGSLLRQPGLADALSLLADNGAAAMYGGDLGKRILAELGARGSAMSMADFCAHEVQTGAGVSATFAGTEYVTTAGNSQGLYFLAGLRALEVLRAEGHELDPLGPSAGRIAVVLARAAAERDRRLGDVDDSAALVAEVLSDEHARSMLAHAEPPDAVRVSAAHGDTAAVVTADGNGGWVSLLQSVFHAFGSGIMEPRYGIVLHNRGASFTLRKGAPGRLTGGRRPPHTLMPVITREGQRITGCQAAMGGRAQPQIQTQISLALAAGADVETAVSRPRWILGVMEAGQPSSAPASARLERDVPEQAKRSIVASGFAVQQVGSHDDEGGHAQLITVGRGDEPVLHAASDPRADGSAAAGTRL